jgi:hypothetical protein
LQGHRQRSVVEFKRRCKYRVKDLRTRHIKLLMQLSDFDTEYATRI